jgi:hypothetical protein
MYNLSIYTFFPPPRYLFPWFGFEVQENSSVLTSGLTKVASSTIRSPREEVMSARNGIVLLLALSTLSLLVGCGSSSPTPQPPPSGGFTVGNFNGTYVLSIAGADANASTESFFAIVGTITADGNGNITGGTVDINDPNIGGVFLAQTVSASPYKITPDGRGKSTLSTPQGSFGLDFVLTSNGHGLITRFDNLGSGSGTLDIQASASQTALTSLAFSLSGTDATSSFLLGSVGGLTLDGSGNITAGTGSQDFNEGGSSAGLVNLPLTGTVVLSSSTAGTAAFNTSFGNLTFDVWVIDSGHLKLIETDATAVLAGDAFTQQTAIPAGTLAFTLSGSDSTGTALAAGGLTLSDGGVNLTSGIEDFNDGGVGGTQPNFTGVCTAFVSGRCQMSLTGFSNGVSQNFQFAVYPSSGGIELLEVDSLGLLQGAAFPQLATSFTASDGYGLNLSGANSNGEVDDIAEFQAGAPTASPNMNPGILDENILGSISQPVNFSGTYTPDTNADGRGSIVVPNISTFNGTLTLQYYVVDSGTVVFIDVDQGQTAAGTFQIQSASSSPGVARPVMFVVRPMMRAHAALKHKIAISVRN